MYLDPQIKNGSFQERDHGRWFTYKVTTDAWALSQGHKHEVDVLDGIRFGTVLKTVAHIAVDEDENGKAVTEKWQLKTHIEWDRA